MNKKQILHVINLVEYVSLIIATIAVLISQFVPYLACVIVGMSFYALGFLLASIRAVINCVEIFIASKRVSGENEALVTTNRVEVLNSKKEKAQAVLSALLWFLLFAFALVVLILYPKTI